MDALIDGCSGADGWMCWQQCAEWKRNRADTMVVEVVMGAVVLMADTMVVEVVMGAVVLMDGCVD